MSAMQAGPTFLCTGKYLQARSTGHIGEIMNICNITILEMFRKQQVCVDVHKYDALRDQVSNPQNPHV
jgi:hypothetical protein